MSNIKSIRLILENCESIEIDAKYVNYLNLRGVKQNKSFKYNRHKSEVESSSNQSIDTLELWLNNKESLKYNNNMNVDETIESRLRRLKDIVSIELIKEGNSKELYYVVFTEDVYSWNIINEYQHCYKIKDDIIILITKDKDLLKEYNKFEENKI